MGTLNYAFELSEFNSALEDGVLTTSPPSKSTITIGDFTEGTHFRTGPDEEHNNALTLKLEDRLLSLLIDESGSMTWNDENGDRYTYFKRLLSKLAATYPGDIKVNIIGFGGLLTATTLLISRDESSASISANNFDQLTLSVFENSAYDFSGIRVVRRKFSEDRGLENDLAQYPQDPNDGDIVADGIFQSVKDSELTEGEINYYGIWSYNRDGHTGTAQYIRAFAYDRDLPEGVHFADASIRILPGIQRDEYTQLIFNFVEGDGYVVYDSSGHGLHGTVFQESILESFWSGDSAVSSYTLDGFLKDRVGVRFDGQYDLLEVSSDPSITYPGIAYVYGSQSITVCFWVYRYELASPCWLMGTSLGETNDIGWAIGFDADGLLQFAFSTITSGFTVSTSSYVAAKTWTHIAVVFNSNGTADVYLNKELSSTGVSIASVDTSNATAFYVGAKPSNSENSWPGVDYFGTLANLSISNTARNAAFISNLYDVESLIFSESLLNQATSPVDNGQREVVIQWIVGSVYNFVDGKIKIIRKYRDIPSHDEDGTLVLEQDAKNGEFAYLDTFEFVHGADYYYRVFTYKKVVIDSTTRYLPCDRADARVLSVYVPRVPHPSDMERPAGVGALVGTQGDRKILLEWVNPTSSEWRGTKVFYGTYSYPTPSYTTTGMDSVDGTEIYDGTGSSFIHRTLGRASDGTDIALQNGILYYYTVVTYDEFGIFSAPSVIAVSPSEDGESVFDPAEIDDLHVEVVNPTTLSIQWNNPIAKSEEILLYMGEVARIFTSVKDIYGGTPDDISHMEYEVFATIEERGLTASNTELGYESPITQVVSNQDFAGKFPDGTMPEDVASEIILSQGVVSSGLLKGSLTHIKDAQILARRDAYIMTVRAKYKVIDPETGADVFIFNSESVRARFINPMRMAIVNKHNRKVSPPLTGARRKGYGSFCECPEQYNSVQAYFDGAYCNSNRPYVVRVEVQSKGTSLTEGYPVNVSLWADQDRTKKPKYTSIREGSYPTTVVESEDDNGHIVRKNFVDVEITVPKMPEDVLLYATVSYNGFVADGFSSIKFIGALFVNLDCRQPVANGISAEEQFAQVWMLHPDYPDDPSQRILPPAGTLVKWSIAPRYYGSDRPFYSTAKISQFLSGVYSATDSLGIARDVFFGPLGPEMKKHVRRYTCDEEPEECCIYEDYVVRAEVTVGDLSAYDEWVFVYECEQNNQFTSQRFLINAADDWADNTGNNPEWITWADGIHMLKFQIAHNPADPDCIVRGAQCFCECVNALNEDAPIFSLQKGAIVSISVPFEIWWGVTFYEDPYTGELTVAHVEHKMSPQIAKEQGLESPLANIELGEGIAQAIPDDEWSRGATDFYLLNNAVIAVDPAQMKLPKTGGSGLADLFAEKGILPNEWKGACADKNTSCSPVDGVKWENVTEIRATTTVIVAVGDESVETQLIAGGGYDDGIPPVLVGFKEPLKAEVLQIRIPSDPYIDLVIERDKDGIPTGRKFVPLEKVADGISPITFVVEATFAGDPVPDNVPIEIEVSGIIELSDCSGESTGCVVSSSGIVRIKNVNDPYLNPGDVPLRSFGYFTINPIDYNVIAGGTQGQITVGTEGGSLGSIVAYVDYDKRGDLPSEETT